MIIIQGQFANFPDMFFGCREDPPEEDAKENKEDQQGDHRVGGDSLNTFHMAFNKFQHSLLFFGDCFVGWVYFDVRAETLQVGDHCNDFPVAHFHERSS